MSGANKLRTCLVGMSMGARKRRAAYDVRSQTWKWPDVTRRDALRMFRDMVAESPHTRHEYRLARKPYRIGQRLRPCPGCAKCHPATRRFAPTAGWKSPRKWILWDGAKLWMIARTWRRLCTVPTLADYTSGVEDGTWKELFCDGSGVLPARERTVRR